MGTVFLGVEPSVGTGVLLSPGSPIIENRRLTPARQILGQLLSSRMPPLINAHGITSLDGVSVGPPYFNENFPLRDGIPLTVGLADGTSGEIQSPVINTFVGAIAIQEVVNEHGVGRTTGQPRGIRAPRSQRLAGVHAKSVIYLFGKGDQGAANPNATAILRAGDLADRATFYRNDLAVAEDSRVPGPAYVQNQD